MKFVVGENGRKPVKNLPRPRFVHHETHMEGPRRELGTPAVGGERLPLARYRLQIPVPSNLTGFFLWIPSIIMANPRFNLHYLDPFDHYSPNS